MLPHAQFWTLQFSIHIYRMFWGYLVYFGYLSVFSATNRLTNKHNLPKNTPSNHSHLNLARWLHILPFNFESSILLSILFNFGLAKSDSHLSRQLIPMEQWIIKFDVFHQRAWMYFPPTELWRKSSTFHVITWFCSNLLQNIRHHDYQLPLQ